MILNNLNKINSFLSEEELKKNEHAYIKYIIQNFNKDFPLEEEVLFDSLESLIYKNLIKIKSKNLNINEDILYDYVSAQKKDIKKEELTEYFSVRRNEFENINYIIEKIKDFKIKNSLLNNIEFSVGKILSKNLLTKEDLVDLSIDFHNTTFTQPLDILDKDKIFYDYEELGKRYKVVLDKRKEGKWKKSLGFPELNNNITRPGAPGEMTALVGRKGSGKSIFAKCMQNYLISQNSCVISFDLEMEEESCYDRILCIRTGYSLDELINSEKNLNIDKKIDEEIKKLGKFKNYLNYPNPVLSLKELDFYLYQAKKIFKNNKVLPEDEYLICFFDLTDMIEDFDGADPLKIKRNLNKLHRIARNHRCHFVLLLQANENKFRDGQIFKKPEDLDYYHLTLEDIEGGAAYGARCRVVLSLNRPLQLKKQFFSARMEEWNLELDVINVNCVKQNDGKLFFTQFGFDNNFRIYPLSNIKNKEI